MANYRQGSSINYIAKAFNPNINTNAYAPEWLQARLQVLRHEEVTSGNQSQLRSDEMDAVLAAVQRHNEAETKRRLGIS